MTKRTVTSQLKQNAYHSIKTRILLNEIRPGDNLGEIELSTEFGMSRTPIREILNQLENERLVKQIPYLGTFVTQLTKEDAREIYEIRGSLEAQAAKTSVIRIPEREIKEFELIHERAQKGLDSGIRNAEINEFRKIHDLIIFHAENKRLSMFIQSLESESQRIVNIFYQSPEFNPRNALDEKYEILLGLKARDTEKVIRLITEHYVNSIHLSDSFLPSMRDIPENLLTPFSPSFLNTAYSIASINSE
jgi:DNA-binding GntR family transcriptional regulator